MVGRLSCVPASLLFPARGEQRWDSGNTAPQSLTLWGRECWGAERGWPSGADPEHQSEKKLAVQEGKRRRSTKGAWAL